MVLGHCFEVITFCDNLRFTFFGSYLLCHIVLNRLCLFLATKLQNSSRITLRLCKLFAISWLVFMFFEGIASFRRVLRNIYANRHFYLALMKTRFEIN